MDLQLKDKVVLVTGGARGIGEAIVRALMAEGATAVIVEGDMEAANGLHGQIPASELIIAELTRAESCYAAVQKTIERFGHVDCLVNSAGVKDEIGLENGSSDRYVDWLARNLLHYYNMAHYALPQLKKTRGAIVNVGPERSAAGQGGTSGYASSKGAILALTREWAAELVAYGIRVNAVVPAEVTTPLDRQGLGTSPDPGGKAATEIPLERRMATPEDIAAVVVFLISGEASHITGQHIFVDGGYVHLDRGLT